MDHQVKVSGYRIELGEIESHLMSHEDIKEAVVMVRAGIHTRSDDKNLCAYLVLRHPGPGESLEYSELKSYLSQFLPGYMIPSYFAELERIPLTPNGKLDVKALPAPSHGMRTKRSWWKSGRRYWQSKKKE
jgi:acyl-coenzyme A synthetase/AMP-(fatty) acid ligase